MADFVTTVLRSKSRKTGIRRAPGRTTEQEQAFAKFRAVVGSYRFRVQAEAEGFPMIPGRYGRIEWHCDGVDCWSCPLAGQFALAVYTDRPRLFDKLWAIPGVRRHQIGDGEMRAVFPAEALEQVAGVIQARRKRGLSSEAARRLGARTAYRATSRS